MNKKLVTISGIQYELDTEDPSYKKRITPEKSIKEDTKKTWNKTKEIAKFIASPEFLKYITPGVNTVAFVKDASTNVKEAFQHLKAGEYQQAAADASYATGNILSGVASLAPFSGLAVKPNPKFKVGITNGAGQAVDLTTVRSKSPVTFTGEELLQHGKTRLVRTLEDAEYREALQKAFPKTWEEQLAPQLQELEKAGLNIKTRPANPQAIMETTRPFFVVGDKELNASSLRQMLAEQYPGQNPEQVLRQTGAPESFIQRFMTGKPEITVSDDVIQALQQQTKLNQEQMRKLFFHEGAHASGVTANTYPQASNSLTTHNAKFKVKPHSDYLVSHYLYKDASPVAYYLKPDEIRARAMSIRRLHQATGESYESILNNWSSGKYRPDPNIDDLIKYYDRESLLNYLTNFLEDGGKINYFDYFQ